MGLLIRLMLCILFAGFALYAYIDRLNDLIELRLAIPVLAKQVQEIREKNITLSYQIQTFESPVNLFQEIRKPEYGHLRFPTINEVTILPHTPLELVDKND